MVEEIPQKHQMGTTYVITGHFKISLTYRY